MDAIVELMKNPVVAGLIGAGVAGGLVMEARKIIPQIGKVIREQFFTSLTVYNDDNIHSKLNVWLSKRPNAHKSRTVLVTEYQTNSASKQEWGLTPGVGWHMVRDKGSFYFFYRHIDTSQQTGSMFNMKRRETMMVYTPGRSQKAIQRLLGEASVINEDNTTVPIYLWGENYFELVQHRNKRDLATIFIPPEQLERIATDMRQFEASYEWYRDRGIPYRRGYLLEGPPGTGKSSLIFALAGHFGRPVYVINPATIQNDNMLQKAFNAVPRDGLLLIEDIDTIQITEKRDDEPVEETTTIPGFPGASKGNGITLSGMLNAIDGVMAREGRVLFITSNHANKLDEALIRPGRIDLREHLGLMELPEAMAMFKNFWPEYDSDEFKRWIKPQLPLSPATMQNVLLSYQPKKK